MMDTFPDLGSLSDQELKDLIGQLLDEVLELLIRQRAQVREGVHHGVAVLSSAIGVASIAMLNLRWRLASDTAAGRP